jgi:DNA-binding transcriptional ArsR family regulator
LKSGRKPQDRDREDALRKLFDLEQANQNRTGPDAFDEKGRYYELKSTTRDRVSTARDVGLGHLRKWCGLYWIFGRGQYTGKTFAFEKTYVLTPVQMEPWFEVIEAKITQDDALFSRALNVLEANGFTPAECDRIRRAFRRGVLLNDPKITWGYIQTHGVEVRREHAKTLRRVLLRPN